MAEKRHEQKISHDVFTILYGSFINKVMKENPEDPKRKLFDIGMKIGARLADDFFLNTRPKKYMELQEISENISEFFFPHYFSFHPDFSQNIIFLKKFPILQYSKVNYEYLEIIRGILHSVYNYLSKDKIEFEVVPDQGEFKIFVRERSHTASLIVTKFSDDTSATDAEP